MLSPVFLLEWKTASRRGRHFKLRAIYGAIVLAEFALYLFGWYVDTQVEQRLRGAGWRNAGGASEVYLPLFMFQHLLLLLLTTPALAAGSITEDKARGTLPQFLTTQLSAGEIVVGKWLGHVEQVLVLALPALPFVLFLHMLAGVPGWATLSWLAESVALTMLLAAASLLASVWSRKTPTAVVAVYVLLTAAIAATVLTVGTAPLDRITLLNPWAAGSAWPLFAGVLAATALCLAVAAWRLRPALAAQSTARPRRRWLRWLDRPPVGAAPVRWKERYIGELGLLAFARRLPRWAGIALALGIGASAALTLPDNDEVFLIHGIGLILVVGILVAVRSSGAISGEREKATWDGLLTTPLENRELVRGKLWGIIDSVKPYLGAYLAGAVVWAGLTSYRAFESGQHAYGPGFAPLVLALTESAWPLFCTVACWLAAWAFLYFQAANGLYWSARSANSWQSMIYTMGSGVSHLFPRSGVLLFAMAVVWTCLVPLTTCFASSVVIYAVVLTGTLIPVCAHAFAQAEFYAEQSEQHIARTDRVVQDQQRWGKPWLAETDRRPVRSR